MRSFFLQQRQTFNSGDGIFSAPLGHTVFYMVSILSSACVFVWISVGTPGLGKMTAQEEVEKPIIKKNICPYKSHKKTKFQPKSASDFISWLSS